jgi:hypothetical protein
MVAHHALLRDHPQDKEWCTSSLGRTGSPNLNATWSENRTIIALLRNRKSYLMLLSARRFSFPPYQGTTWRLWRR